MKVVHFASAPKSHYCRSKKQVELIIETRFLCRNYPLSIPFVNELVVPWFEIPFLKLRKVSSKICPRKTNTLVYVILRNVARNFLEIEMGLNIWYFLPAKGELLKLCKICSESHPFVFQEGCEILE